ncbi:MAG: hypothetical protein KJ906_03455 [Nanoarchaeota archaeon]|nr:hypothetical protein [Nanoarchaeota archaeon]
MTKKLEAKLIELDQKVSLMLTLLIDEDDETDPEDGPIKMFAKPFIIDDRIITARVRNRGLGEN